MRVVESGFKEEGLLLVCWDFLVEERGCFEVWVLEVSWVVEGLLDFFLDFECRLGFSFLKSESEEREEE